MKLADSHFAELNTLDDELLAELENGDGPGFRHTLHALLDRIRELGEPLPDDSLEPSELILLPGRHAGRGQVPPLRHRPHPPGPTPGPAPDRRDAVPGRSPGGARRAPSGATRRRRHGPQRPRARRAGRRTA